MSCLWEKVPLPEQYWEAKPGTKLLVGPPLVIRLSFMVDVMIAAAIFIYCAYYTLVDQVLESRIEYDPKDGYVCRNLSPRNSAYTLSTNSEEIDFSSSRFLLTECLEALESTGYDVCNDNNRQDVISTTRYLSSERISKANPNQQCIDILFDNEYRACIGSDVISSVEPSNYSATFPNQPKLTEIPPLLSFSKKYLYFMNSTYYKGFDIDGIYNSIASDFISVGATAVAFLCKITSTTPGSPPTTNIIIADVHSSSLKYIALPSSYSSIFGFTASPTGDSISVMTMTANHIASVFTYFLASGTSSDVSVNCGNYFVFGGDSVTSTSSFTRYLSYSDLGHLYLICNTAVVTIVASAPPQGGPPIDPVLGALADVYYADFYNMDTTNVTYADGTPLPQVTSINQLVVIGSTAYVLVDNAVLLSVDLTSQPTPSPTAAPTPDPSPSPTTHPTMAPVPANSPTFSPTTGGGGGGGGPPPAGPPTVRRLLSEKDGTSTDYSYLVDQGLQDVVEEHPRRVLFNTFNTTGLILQPIHGAGHFSPDPSLKSSSFIATTALATSVSNFPVIQYSYNYEANPPTSVFNPSDSVVTSLSGNNGLKFYYALDIGYFYGLCAGEITQYAMTYGSQTGYSDACGQPNGVYYQNNSWHEVPVSCLAPMQTSGVDAIFDCSSFQSYWSDYIQTACYTKSIAKVCKQSYTANSPFFCSKYVKNNVITVLSTAFANAGAFRGLWIIIVIWIFGRFFPEKLDLHQTLSNINKNVHDMHDAMNKQFQHIEDAVSIGVKVHPEVGHLDAGHPNGVSDPPV